MVPEFTEVLICVFGLGSIFRLSFYLCFILMVSGTIFQVWSSGSYMLVIGLTISASYNMLVKKEVFLQISYILISASYVWVFFISFILFAHVYVFFYILKHKN